MFAICSHSEAFRCSIKRASDRTWGFDAASECFTMGTDSKHLPSEPSNKLEEPTVRCDGIKRASDRTWGFLLQKIQENFVSIELFAHSRALKYFRARLCAKSSILTKFS
jgi:hypothetical protein